MLTNTIDSSGLNTALNGVKDALIGTGGDATEVVKDESRLFAMQMMKLSQPQDKKKLEGKIEKSVTERFFSFENSEAMNEDWKAGVSSSSKWSGRQSSSGVEWFGATRNFLFGYDNGVRDMRKADGQAMANAYYTSAMKSGRANIIREFKWPRNQQRVAIVKKILTSPASLKRGVKVVQESIGKLSASWLASARQIDKTKSKAPAWIERHLRNGDKSSKSITDLSQANKSESPSVTVGSKARGASSEKGLGKVQFALKVRATKLQARLNLILSGYSQDVANGIKARRHAKSIKGVE